MTTHTTEIKHAHRKYLADEMLRLLAEPYFHDSVIVCDDGSIPCNRLILALLFQDLTFDCTEENFTLIIPGTLVSEQINEVKKILSHDKTCCITRDATKTVKVNVGTASCANETGHREQLKDEFEAENFKAEVVMDPEEDMDVDEKEISTDQSHGEKQLLNNGLLTYNEEKSISLFPCGTPHCSETFSSKSQRSKHHYKVHSINYYCPYCMEEFDSDVKLKEHKKTHLTFMCNAEGCERKFYTEARRNLHHRREHPDLQSVKTLIKPREYSASGIVCEICGKEIVGANNIRNHSARCHKKLEKDDKSLNISKGHTCPICFLYFEIRMNYTKHLKTHNEISPARTHTCEHCGKSFETKGSLNVHLRTHSDYRPYKCDLCDMRFKHDCNRKSHQNTHTGTKLFDCDICGKSYAQHSSLKSHQRSAHLNQTYNCEHCGEAYKRKYNFRQHKKKCDGKNSVKKSANQYRRPEMEDDKDEKEEDIIDDITPASDEDLVRQYIVVEDGQDFVCNTPDPVKFVVVPSNILNVVVAD